MKIAYVKYLAALILLGSNGVIASYILLSSTQIVFLRTLIGGIVLIGVFLATRQRFTSLQDKRNFFYLALSGIAMGCGWLFVYQAYQLIGVSLSTLLYYCGPIIVMALSPLLFKERITVAKVLGFTAVVVGLFLVNGLALQDGASVWGILCGVGAAVTYAVMVFFNKKARGVSGLENTVLQVVFGFLTAAIFLAITGGLPFTIPTDSWPPVLMLGVVNTGIACYWYFSSIGHLPAQTVAVCGYLEPLSAVVFSFLILHEQMMPLQILGAVLIIGGAIFCEVKSLRSGDEASAEAV